MTVTLPLLQHGCYSETGNKFNLLSATSLDLPVISEAILMAFEYLLDPSGQSVGSWLFQLRRIDEILVFSKKKARTSFGPFYSTNGSS